MWTVVYIARNRAAGQRVCELRVCELLQREGLLVKMRPLGDGADKDAVELLVPEAEAEEAHEVLASVLGR